MTETDGAAQNPVGDIGEIDAGGTVHPHPRRDPAEFFEYRHPIAPGEPATRVSVEGSDTDDRVVQVGVSQGWLRHPIFHPRTPRPRRVALFHERQPRQPRHWIAVV